MIRIIEPPLPIVSLAEAKRFMRIIDGGDDMLVSMLVAAAQAEIEPPTSWVGRAFGEQTIELVVHGCVLKSGIALPFPPLRSIVSVTYLDTAGVLQTLPEDAYTTCGAPIATLVPAHGQTWPEVLPAPNAVTVRFVAGYEDNDPQLMPARMAVILIAQRLRAMAREDVFVKRETVDGVGSTEWALTTQAADMAKQASDSMLARFRIWGP